MRSQILYQKQSDQTQVPCIASTHDVTCDELLKELDKNTTKPFVCESCQKQFAYRNSMYRHRKTCMHYASALQDLQQEIIELKSSIAQLTKDKEKDSTSTFNNVTVTNIQTQNNIVINGLGKENTDYIKDEFIARCIKDKADGVCSYLVNKHFNHRHPENHNLKKSRRDDFMEFYDGRTWKLKYNEDLLDDVFAFMYSDFANFVDEAISDEGKIKRVWLDNFMRAVGQPLDWDLSNDDYEFNETMSDNNKAILKSKIYKLACEYIYRHSQNTAMVK